MQRFSKLFLGLAASAALLAVGLSSGYLGLRSAGPPPFGTEIVTKKLDGESPPPEDDEDRPSENVPISKGHADNDGMIAVTKPDRPDTECRARMAELGVINAASPCIDIGQVVAKLRVGKYYLNKPEKALVNEPLSISLVLQTSDSQDVKSYFAGLSGSITSQEGKFAQSVEATLYGGDDLGVVPPGPLKRTVTGVEEVVWNWTVTPRSEGTKVLLVEVDANIRAGTENHRVHIRTLRESITFEVTTIQRLTQYASSTNGALVTACTTITAIVGVWALLRRRKKPAEID